MPQTPARLPRFLANTDDPREYLAFTEDPEALAQEALEHTIADNPPRSEYSSEQCRGLFRGPTALACLFLKLSVRHTALQAQGVSLRDWAGRYMAAKRKGRDSVPCGLAWESVSYWAVQTMMDESNATRFRTELERLAGEDGHPHELLFAYAGLLYMIHSVEKWRPETSSQLSMVKARIVEKLLGAGPHWTWRDKRYIGAVHGDIGILTQLLLTDEKLASKSMIRNSLDRLLTLQRDDGNWNTKDDDDPRYDGLVQVCHGAPGILLSLIHIRRLFPDMDDRIEEAINMARQAIWKLGLLRKEPCICHGILGNALAFPPGRERDHFLAWSVPSKIAQERQRDATLFPSEDASKMPPWFCYWPGAA
ncbi:abscisic acid aba receptor [Colletotrichum sojae]|uniref:Abscisic acid aba receptor n=1 Tax=Colletotrichum sojae TaxID=2175907 RepID=A0A8H6JAM1_9PEZI|nr:abscisic acid aba receptor [Colletotrichum sojae]